jgi:Sec-independent protein translocase protein TatA
MDILGIGIPEFIFILIIAIIVLGPNDMQKAGKTIGTWMRKVVLSPEWKEIKDASRKLKHLPNQLMREANLEEIKADYEKFSREINVTLPNLTVDKSPSLGTWSGEAVSESDTIASPPPPSLDVNNTPDSVKQADEGQKTPPVNDSPPAETDNA